MPLEFANQHLTPEQEAALKPIGRRFVTMLFANLALTSGVVLYMFLAKPSHYSGWAGLALCLSLIANRIVMERMAAESCRITGRTYRPSPWRWLNVAAFSLLLTLFWIIPDFCR